MTELMAIFRSSLLALLPVMNAARIPWSEPNAYDPWYDITRVLHSSIIGSCVEHSVARLLPLNTYEWPTCEANSFISEYDLRNEGVSNALMSLETDIEPFDTVLLNVLDTNLIPTGRTVRKAFCECNFELAGRTPGGIAYYGEIIYVA